MGTIFFQKSTRINVFAPKWQRTQNLHACYRRPSHPPKHASLCYSHRYALFATKKKKNVLYQLRLLRF